MKSLIEMSLRVPIRLSKTAKIRTIRLSLTKLLSIL